MSDVLISINPQGDLVETTVRTLDPGQVCNPIEKDQIRKLALAMVPDMPAFKIDKDTWIYFGDTITMFRRVEAVNFTSRWELSTEMKLVFAGMNNNNPKLSFTWKPDQFGTMYFVLDFPWGTSRDGVAQPRLPVGYMFIKRPGVSAPIVPPIPNIYADGKVCFGSAVNSARPSLFRDPTTCFEALWQYWMSSVFHNDLMWNAAVIKTAVSFDLEGNQIPVSNTGQLNIMIDPRTSSTEYPNIIYRLCEKENVL